MDKREFIKLVYDNAKEWGGHMRNEEIDKLIAYCYDVLSSKEEFERVSIELANTKQELDETKQEVSTLETYKSGYSRLYAENENYKKELAAYKDVAKAQAALIELR